MGKFDIAAIVGGIAVLVFFSQFESTNVAPDAPPAEPAARASRPEQSQPGREPRKTGGFSVPPPSSGQSAPNVVYGQKIKETFSGVLLSAIDGDSLKVKRADGTEREVRLASIDAPEWNQPYGQPAKAHVRALIGDRPATFYQTGIDRFGRTLAFVLAQSSMGKSVDVNAAMVADGFAWHSIAFSNDASLQSIEENARANRRGLWNQNSPTPPWTHRSKK